ncbi:MAG: FAD-dependent oxidoreductase, partial [Chitinophagales bacterium]
SPVADLAQQMMSTEVLVVGGGTGGVSAAISSARSGSKTILVESGNMLGGMLSAAGVSCTDGNDALPGGIWEEFRQALYAHYGTKNLATGWVSETCFEPHVADSIFKSWARQPNLTVIHGWKLERVLKEGERLLGVYFSNGRSDQLLIKAKISIDGTELGDLLAKAGAAYDLGTEDSSYSKEQMAPGKTDIIQDITWTAILKDFGPGSDKTISKPAGYDPLNYYCCCTSAPCKDKAYPADAKAMLNYGKLPHEKYMINWPAHGNDYYANLVDASEEIRKKTYEAAKLHTRGFVYFIQTQLGYKNLGLAEDELNGGMALIPYNREGRRARGVVRLNINQILDPYHPSQKLYRTGIAVGDYPVDHHHGQNPQTPIILFPRIPSFSIPLGALIPEKIDGLIVCEKGISVSNIVNGATRLQPVVMLTAEAAGILASWSVRNKMQPRNADARSIQQQLLDASCDLLPFVDVKPTFPDWQSIQRIGVTGILKGRGKPEGWANKTFFDPDSSITENSFVQELRVYQPDLNISATDSVLSKIKACLWVDSLKRRLDLNSNPSSKVQAKNFEEICKLAGIGFDQANRPIKRRELARLLDQYAQVFTRKRVNLQGDFVK